MIKKEMKHFFKTDINDVLFPILEKNTETHRSDFSQDINIFKDGAKSKNSDDKFLFWLSRKNGTICLRVRDIFISDTAAHTTLMYYGNSKGREENYIAYLVEIIGMNCNNKIIGNLNEINFDEFLKDVSQKSVAYGSKKIIYENGEKFVSGSSAFSYNDSELGNCIAFVDMPKEPEILKNLLLEEKNKYCISD